jgi:hypothetical protein
MPKIQFGDYQNFLAEYYTSPSPRPRFGEAFCKRFQIGNDGFLFFEKNEIMARMMAYKEYVREEDK